MEQNYWSLGTWRRVPVSMHWTVLFVFVWLYLIFFDLAVTAIASVAFFALLVIHELGHVAVMRRRRIAVTEIRFYGLHGRTVPSHAAPRDEMAIAWGGVGAQFLVLMAALAVRYLLPGSVLLSIPGVLLGPVLFVFIQLNLVLMIIALLPIGPFDGHAAWQVFAMMKASRIKRRKRRQELRMFPERGLPDDKRRELEESSSKAAAELLEKLASKRERDAR
ncbi:MAG TPA: hypothetical protein VFE23_20040 [Usitatibacter sp.]|jgi:Zn-dependent protease|nr:hypothetical protein [Usitatibacter sp.]